MPNKVDLSEEILEVMDKLGVDYMPSSSQLKSNGYCSLDSRIQNSGGFVFWAEKLNIKNKERNKAKWTDDTIRSEILKVVDIIEEYRMPTSSEMKNFGKSGSDSAIQRYGGYSYWASKLNLKTKKSVTKWNEKSIIKCIEEVRKKLNIDRMPNSTEIVKYHSKSLHSAITKYGGYYYFADRLNLELKDSDTVKGYSNEIIVKKMLEENSFYVEKMDTLYPFDLYVNNSLKIDVKSAKMTYEKNGTKRGHIFGINKKYPTCDIYAFVKYDKDNKDIIDILFVPSVLINTSSTITLKDNDFKYYSYNFDVISDFCNFYNKFKS